MALPCGAKLGPYEILSSLGVGFDPEIRRLHLELFGW